MTISLPARPGLLLLTFPLVLATRLALWCVPYRVLRLVPRRLATRLRRAGQPDWSSEHIARYVRFVSRFVPGATCLTQALATELLLRVAGVDCTLRIGVAKDQHGKVLAHAWVERGRTVVIGGPRAVVARYTPLPDLDRSPVRGRDTGRTP